MKHIEMFNQTALLHFAHFIVFLNKRDAFLERFVFDENTNDVVSLHGLHYEQEYFQDANGRYLRISISNHKNNPLMFLITWLMEMINFNIQLIFSKQNWEKDVFIGINDMNLVVYSTNSPYRLVHPTFFGSHQLFVVNLGMVGTPTYFLELFHVYLWIAFLVTFTLIGIFSTLGMYLLQRHTMTRYDYFSWYSMLTNQGGGDDNSRLVFPKILLIIISIISITFYGSFEAFLSSYLAIRIPDLPFKTLDELSKFPEYSICTPYGTSSHGYLMDHFKSDLITRNRVNNMFCPKEFKERKVFMLHEKLKDYCPKVKTVFFAPAIIKTADKSCLDHSFTALPEKFDISYTSILVSPGFKYREQFNRALIKVRTAGFLNRFQSILNNVYNDNNRLEKFKHNSTVDFHQTKYILLIPVVGIVLGIVVLMIELLIKNY